MASTMPSLSPGCCVPDCEDPLSIAVPGPQGDDGAAGAGGAAGAAAYTTFTAAFVMPAELASAVATVANTSFLAVNQIVYAAKTDGSVQGVFQVTAIGGATSVTLKNLEDAATGAYAANSAAGTTFTIGSMLVPSGSQGQQASVSGSTIAGDVTGTIGATALTVNSALGALPVGNGTKATSLAKGTDGQILTSDAAAALDLQWKSVLPITGGTDVADNRILRLDTATGLPIPGQSSRVTVTDTGAIRADGSGGNARGTDAVDLQVIRAGAAQVASGTRSFVGGGENNSALSTESVVVGGDTNTAGVAGVANQAGIVAGHDNTASGDASFVGAGDTNIASGQESVVAGGNGNVASNVQSAVVGGDSNTASGDESFVGGGGNNIASAENTTVGGGDTNYASGPYSTVPGGKNAAADKHGQMAWSAGGFSSVPGSAQVSELVWSLITLNAAPNKPMFLDGISLLATIGTSKTWAFDILVAARSAAGVGAAWRIVGAIQNSSAGVSSLVSAVTTVLIAADAAITGTWGVVGNVVVEADTANDALNIRVAATVDPAVTVRWVASGKIVEITH